MTQTAVNQLVSDAQNYTQHSTGQPSRALREFMQMKVNNLSSHGYVNLTEEYIHFSMDAANTLNLFSFLSHGSASLPIAFDEATYHFDSSLLIVTTRRYGAQTLIPDILRLQNIKLSLNVNLQNISTPAVNFTGDWIIDTRTISIVANYHRQSEVVNLMAQLSTFSINFQTLVSSVVAITLPHGLSESVSKSDFAISGSATFSSNFGFQLYVAATRNSTRVYAIYRRRDTRSTTQKAVAVEIPNIRFSSILQLRYNRLGYHANPLFWTRNSQHRCSNCNE